MDGVDAGDAHGASVGLMFAPWTSPYFYPSIEVELDGTISAPGISGAGGVGLNGGLGEVIGASLKLVLRGHGASLADQWESGLSLDVVAGVRSGVFFFDASFPVVRKALAPAYTLTVGLRFDLL